MTRALILLTLSATAFVSSADAQIFWTETRSDGSAFIMRANADGTNPTELVSGAANIKGPNGLEFGNGRLFWPDQQLNAIKSVQPDGQGVTEFTPAANPYDVFIGDRVYWTSQTGNYIDTQKLDGTDFMRPLNRNTVNRPFPVEVTAANIYWAEVSGSGRLRRSDLAGANIITLVNNVFSYDFQIVGGLIYIGDNNFPAGIKRADLDGGNVITLTPVTFLNGLCVTKDAIYWSDLQSVNRCSLTGADPITLINRPEAAVRGVVFLEETPGPKKPVVGNPQLIAGDLIFTLQGDPGQTIHVESTPVLPSPTWTDLGAYTAAATPLQITNHVGTTPGPKLFRARVD